ncbi:MAG TPA: hypothetical protein VK014_06070 [Cyclobacteriaceae bacterium]|nr:hypothetical protein [Cyclobacteriaceae bacterium]
MKKLLAMLSLALLMTACGVSRNAYDLGMEEKKFLRQNKSAVINNMEGQTKTYRVNRDDGFYILATFENGRLIKFEERELTPAWQQQRLMDQNK